MKKRIKKPGCLWLLAVLLGGGMLSLIGFLMLDAPLVLTLAAAFMLAIWLVNRLYGKPKLENLVSGTLGIIVLFTILATGFAFLVNLMSPELEIAQFEGEESVREVYLPEGSDSVMVYRSHRKWQDNYGRNYAGYLTVRDRDFRRLKNHARNFGTRDNDNFWGALYRYIERTDRPAMDLVMQSFDSIGRANRLDRMAFAEMVVSCIQDIPYSFVFQQACRPAEAYEDAIRLILEDCPECCVGNVPFGVQTPVGFMQNLKGDCDSRTVLIYGILKHFGYDVAILNSDYYQHSVLGLNLPARGKAKIHKGRRYLVWETTAKFFEVGVLPPAYGDLTHWNVILNTN